MKDNLGNLDIVVKIWHLIDILQWVMVAFKSGFYLYLEVGIFEDSIVWVVFTVLVGFLDESLVDTVVLVFAFKETEGGYEV